MRVYDNTQCLSTQVLKRIEIALKKKGKKKGFHSHAGAAYPSSVSCTSAASSTVPTDCEIMLSFDGIKLDPSSLSNSEWISGMSLRVGK